MKTTQLHRFTGKKLRFRGAKSFIQVTLLAHEEPGFESRWVDFRTLLLTGETGKGRCAVAPRAELLTYCTLC